MYKRSHTKERVQQVCDLAGVKYSWFDLCARGHGKFSIDAAIDLEAASTLFSEGYDDKMTVPELCNTDDRVSARIGEMERSLTDAA